MIDLDRSLGRLRRARGAEWNDGRAVELSHAVAARLNLWIQYEPGDEEWVILDGPGYYAGMVSIRFPFVVALPRVMDVVEAIAPNVVRVRIDDFLADELRASPALLRSTVLPYEWHEVDFDPEAFSANDLFVGSV